MCTYWRLRSLHHEDQLVNVKTNSAKYLRTPFSGSRKHYNRIQGPRNGIALAPKKRWTKLKKLTSWTASKSRKLLWLLEEFQAHGHALAIYSMSFWLGISADVGTSRVITFYAYYKYLVSCRRMKICLIMQHLHRAQTRSASQSLTIVYDSIMGCLVCEVNTINLSLDRHLG